MSARRPVGKRDPNEVLKSRGMSSNDFAEFAEEDEGKEDMGKLCLPSLERATLQRHAYVRELFESYIEWCPHSTWDATKWTHPDSDDPPSHYLNGFVEYIAGVSVGTISDRITESTLRNHVMSFIGMYTRARGGRKPLSPRIVASLKNYVPICAERQDLPGGKTTGQDFRRLENIQDFKFEDFKNSRQTSAISPSIQVTKWSKRQIDSADEDKPTEDGTEQPHKDQGQLSDDDESLIAPSKRKRLSGFVSPTETPVSSPQRLSRIHRKVQPFATGPEEEVAVVSAKRPRKRSSLGSPQQSPQSWAKVGTGQTRAPRLASSNKQKRRHK